MSTGLMQQMHLKDSSATEVFGEQIGRNLLGGECIELVSDLGGGKTTLVRGIARGAGSSDTVSSPTFTISKVYKTPGLTIYHFDFYRLNEPGLITHELQDALEDPHGVVITEWSDSVQHVLPSGRLTIRLSKNADNGRIAQCNYPENLAYLVSA